MNMRDSAQHLPECDPHNDLISTNWRLVLKVFPFMFRIPSKIFPTAIKSNKPIISRRHFIKEQRGFLLI